MTAPAFTGDKKAPLKTWLAPFERRFIDANLHRFPQWIEGYHLTLMTILWSAGLLCFGRLAPKDPRWLWGSSLMLFLQWFTDCFDGALGRSRDTGIPKWGFFMDHFLDYIFLCCIVGGYAFLLSSEKRILLLILIPVFGAFMVSSFLAFGATGEFKITYLGTGPTEMRIAFILLNTVIIFCGFAWLESVLTPLLISSLAVLAVVTYRTQKFIWKLDKGA